MCHSILFKAVASSCRGRLTFGFVFQRLAWLSLLPPPLLRTENATTLTLKVALLGLQFCVLCWQAGSRKAQLLADLLMH